MNIDIEFDVKNFKSYFGDPVSFKVIKPITIIAGPNGEGKTNLLEAMLVGVSNFINHSHKLRKNTLFTAPVKLSLKSEISTSLSDLIFTDNTKKSLARRPTEISYPERLDPSNIITHKKNVAEINLKIFKKSESNKL